MPSLSGSRWTDAAAALALGTILVPVAAVSASQLVDVRIGIHEDFTRVVLETDSPAPHEVDRDGSREVRVRLAAEATARQLEAPGSLLRSVRIEPASDGSLARLDLRSEHVEIREHVLADPPRIVLDLREGAAPSRAEVEAIPPGMSREEPGAPAPALASITDVRVGLHEGWTRVVIETNGPSHFEFKQTSASELVVVGNAQATPRKITAPGSLVRSIEVERTKSGSSTRLHLEKPGLEVRYQVLEAPPRLVLDVREGAVATKAKIGAVLSAPRPEPVATEVVGSPSAGSKTPQASEPSPAPSQESRATTPQESEQPSDVRPASGEAASALPGRTGTKIYKWVDENGVAHYTADIDRIPEQLRDGLRHLGDGNGR